MISIKKYFKDKNNTIHENAIPKKQILKIISNHIKRVGNFGTATLILVDIDNSQNLFEMYGVELQNQVLKEMAQRIANLLPTEAYFSQISTDGVLIFIPSEAIQTRIEKLCKRILDSIKSCSYQEEFQRVPITASIGVCIYPQAGSTVKRLLENLDMATFVSKRNGGNKVTTYYATLSEDERDNMIYYEEIHTAIQKKEFVLYYQPIIDITNHQLFGAEALMRWNHPTKGILSPGDFMKLLEQTGDIHWVGRWGIDSIIHFQQSLSNKYPELHLLLSLNLCLKQLLNPSLAPDLIAITKSLNAKPSRIMLEITDFMVYKNMKAVEANILKLKSFGFKIAVDGFPLETQSVLAIQETSIDVIKLGRMFLKDITNNFSQEKLLISLLDYCKKKKKILICEGIETKELLEYVKEQNVDYGSGFYFSKALNIPSLLKYIEAEKWKEQLDIDSEVEK